MEQRAHTVARSPPVRPDRNIEVESMVELPVQESSPGSDVRYHFVWATRRRSPFLAGDVLDQATRLLNEAARPLGIRITDVGSGLDYLVVTVEATPDLAPSTIVARLKRYSASGLRQRFPALCRLPSIWTRRYFVSTTDVLDPARVEVFVRSQPRSERRRRDAAGLAEAGHTDGALPIRALPSIA